MNLLNYFSQTVTRPKDLSAKGISYGRLNLDVSRTTLRLFAKFSVPVAGYVLDRKNSTGTPVFIRFPYYFGDEPVELKTKGQLVDFIQSGGDIGYFNGIDCLRDDFVFLSRFENEKNPDENHYLFFYVDVDDSKNMIGKFSTKDPEEKTLELFESYLLSSLEKKQITGFHKLPANFLKKF